MYAFYTGLTREMGHASLIRIADLSHNPNVLYQQTCKCPFQAIKIDNRIQHNLFHADKQTTKCVIYD